MSDNMGLGMTRDINKSIASSRASASPHGSEDRASTCPSDEFRDDFQSHPKSPTPKRTPKPTDSVVPMTKEELDAYVQACRQNEKWIKENPSIHLHLVLW